MKAEEFVQQMSQCGVDYYTGVPDSLLSPLCGELLKRYGTEAQKHVVAANEGGAVALAAGHYLATGRPAMVYLQNSGIGNIINPVCSLIHDEVYGLPVVFVVGWRGEPQTKDEPQHRFQGKVTRELLDCVGIDNVVVTPETSAEQFQKMLLDCAGHLKERRPFAFVMTKGALEGATDFKQARAFPLSREQAVEVVLRQETENTFYVSTTGKLSRELFELRERNGQGHEKDFLTVGSMGHSVMIALGIAAAHPDKRIICLDGDGAALMHMGNTAVAGSCGCGNLTEIVFNNSAHESVGGVPTVGDRVNFVEAAAAYGYKTACRVETADELEAALLKTAGKEGPHFLEVLINLEVRKDLGRPTRAPKENRDAFMERLQGKGHGL